MERLNKPYYTLIAIAGFIVLAIYSQHYVKRQDAELVRTILGDASTRKDEGRSTAITTSPTTYGTPDYLSQLQVTLLDGKGRPL